METQAEQVRATARIVGGIANMKDAKIAELHTPPDPRVAAAIQVRARARLHQRLTRVCSFRFRNPTVRRQSRWTKLFTRWQIPPYSGAPFQGGGRILDSGAELEGILNDCRNSRNWATIFALVGAFFRSITAFALYRILSDQTHSQRKKLTSSNGFEQRIKQPKRASVSLTRPSKTSGAHVR
jgi:hypothetical protein